MKKKVLVMKKSAFIALCLQYGIMRKGGKLPIGSVRTWGGAEYVKVAPGDWRLKSVAGKTKRPANLQKHIHLILHGIKEEKENLQRTFFHMADTPDFMKKLGLSGEYFSVRYGVISRHLGKDVDHALKEKDWIDLCKEITTPFAIAKYGEGYRLFTNVKVNEVFTAVGVNVKKPGKDLEVNSVMTAFGYKGLPEQEKFIYVSKKLTPEQAALLEGLNPPQYPSDQGPGRRT